MMGKKFKPKLDNEVLSPRSEYDVSKPIGKVSIKLDEDI